MRAAYGRIYEDLKEQIEDGTFAYEELLPSQTQLVARYGVAHNTVRKALAQLAGEGYCLPIHGKGVRVIWRRDTDGTPLVMDGVEDFVEEAAHNATDVVTRVLAFETMRCDDRVALRTGFSAGDELVYVERIRQLGGKALVRDRSYFRAASVGGLTRELATRSIYAYAEGVLGVKIVTGKRTVTIEPTDADDAAKLDLDGCDHLAVIETQVFDGDGRQFEHTQSRRHPSCFCLRETVTRAR